MPDCAACGYWLFADERGCPRCSGRAVRVDQDDLPSSEGESVVEDHTGVTA